jgi:hypothetical protein
MPARQWLGIALVIFSIGVTFALAVAAGAKTPPSQATYALFVLVSAAAQIGAAWAFSGVGRADPTLARSSVVGLFWLTRRASSAGETAQSVFEEATDANDLRMALGIASTEFSWLEEGLLLQIDGWRSFHKQVVNDAEGEQTDDD